MKLNAKRILSLVLTALLILPAANAFAAETPPAGVITSNGSTVSHFDYFSAAYPNLNDASHVFKTLTYEDVVQLFDTDGTYAVVFGGAANASTQAQIGYIDQVAKAQGIQQVYNFDTKLDGKGNLDIADSSNSFAYKYTDLIHKYLTNSTAASDVLNKTFVFVYNKNHKDAEGNSAPVIASYTSAAGAADFLTDGALDATKVNDYKDQIKQVLSKNNVYSTISNYDLITPNFNRNGQFYAATPTYPLIFNDTTDKNFVLEHVTYDELDRILDSHGNYAILLGGSWCPNTQAAIKYVNEYAKKYNVDKVYLWDPRLDAGVDVTVPVLLTDSKTNPHENAKLMIRDTASKYAYLYVDLVNKYLTNISTQYVKATTNVNYTDAGGTKIIANRLQVPYFFTYDKDNKDANNNSAPILGHIELMYSWAKTSDITNPTYLNYITALNNVLSRLESVPTGLQSVAVSVYNGTDGQITGITNGSNLKALEYKKAEDSTYTAVTGTAITGLKAGSYNVRYASIKGAQSASGNNYSTVNYNPGQSIDVVVPNHYDNQDAPQGLKSIAPSALDAHDGQITDTQAGQEFKLVGEAAYQDAPVPSITGLVYGDYLVRYKAKEGFNPSPDTQVTVPKPGEQAPPAGLAGVAPTAPDQNDGKITGLTEGLEYKLKSDEEAAFTKVTGEVLTDLAPGVYLFRYAAKTGYVAGPAVEVTVPVYTNLEQEAPTGLAGVAPSSSADNNGKITGTSVGQEYRKHGVSTYTAALGTEITGLSAGTYHVRYAAKNGYNAGADTEVVVPAYVAPTSPPVVSTPAPTATPTPAPTATPSPSESTGGKTVASATVESKTDASTGLTSAAVAADTVNGLIDSAKKAEASGQSAVIELKIGTTSATQTAELSIPRELLNAVATGTKAEVKINYEGFGALTFDAKALASINAASGTGDISFRITKAELTDEGKQVLGDRPVYDLAVNAGDSTVSSFGGGDVKVHVPYTLKSGEVQNAIIVYYVNETTGNLDTVRGKYNASTGEVEFTTKHFSQYIVAYNKVSFADVAASSWYGNAVDFLAARSITTGTDDSHYSPSATVTRGQFIVLLLKAYGIAPEAGATDNFSDAGSKYYTEYLAAAKRLGIATGAGDNKFAPDKAISRQELFTILYRALNVLGEVPTDKSGAGVSNFSDAGNIAGYAQDAFKALVESGVITGNGGKLSPADVTTRAQVAQVLFNLLSK